jgi:hypothetical protein
MSLVSSRVKDGRIRKAGRRNYRPRLESLEGRAVPSTVAGHVELPIAVAHAVRTRPKIEPGRGVWNAIARDVQDLRSARPSVASPFDPVKHYDASSHPTAVVSFEDNDVLYFAVLNRDYGFKGGVSVLRADGRGGLDFVRRYDLNWLPSSLAVGDFNHDGIPDLAVARELKGDVELLLGEGNGAFRFGGTFGSGPRPVFVTVAKLTADGYPDVIVANKGERPFPGACVSVLLGNGDGTLQAPRKLTAGISPTGVAVGDFNGDGKPDLAVSNNEDNYVNILMGNGDGTFQPPRYLHVGTYTQVITTADFNGDGKLDLAIGADGHVFTFMGNGDGTFRHLQTLDFPRTPHTLTAADLNDEGRLDLVTAIPTSGSIAVLYGRGDGTFSPLRKFPAGANPVAVAVADVNSDRIDDLIAANLHGGNVGVLLGRRAETRRPVASRTMSLRRWVADSGGN